MRLLLTLRLLAAFHDLLHRAHHDLSHVDCFGLELPFEIFPHFYNSGLARPVLGGWPIQVVRHSAIQRFPLVKQEFEVYRDDFEGSGCAVGILRGRGAV